MGGFGGLGVKEKREALGAMVGLLILNSTVR